MEGALSGEMAGGPTGSDKLRVSSPALEFNFQTLDSNIWL